MGRVKVGTGRPYEVIIESGLLEKISEYLEPWRERQLFLLTDDHVKDLYADSVLRRLREAGFMVVQYSVPAGEGSKSMESLASLMEAMALAGIHRDGLLIALGGGVVGDLGGFAAAVYQRGIDFIQIPTTLLACVDSSVGGKTAVNLLAGKNLAGAFHQPVVVLADPSSLRTLSAEFWSDGMAEVIKYGVLFDRDLFLRTAEGVTARDEDLTQIISRCVELKAAVVAEDETDRGQRQLLNLGHTFGHAIEKASGFSVSHGHAVAAGMAMIARACRHRGLCSEKTVQEIENALTRNGLPTSTTLPREELIQAAARDKKASGQGITLVTIDTIGSCSLRRTSLTDLAGWLEDTQK